MVKTTINNGKKVYLVAGMRTPFGKFGGSLRSINPVDLAVHASKGLFTTLGLAPDIVDHVIFGNVAPSTTDTIYGGRHLALKLGMPKTTPGYNVNRLCGSGIQIILDAVNLIKLQKAEVVLAAGSENMSLMPQLLYGGRFGTRYGNLQTVDMLLDTLTDKFTGMPMAMTAEKMAEIYDVSRKRCDEFSMRSHLKACEAKKQGFLKGEITPFESKQGECREDEHVRGEVKLEELMALTASFKKGGVVTPATASGVVDGACSVLVASESAVKRFNLSPLAEIVDGEVIGVDPTIMGIGPVPAVKKLLDQNSLKVDDVDLFEINEAFAVQVLACSDELRLSESKLNVWGGSIAVGHPLGATGTRLALTLARQLSVLDKQYGVASACIGGGQGISVLLKKV